MKMTCRKCGYEWETKTEKKPKSCPSCKQYLERKTVIKTNQKGEK
jgi:predicted Zn-ribbon and HTH transcriptional regulator